MAKAVLGWPEGGEAGASDAGVVVVDGSEGFGDDCFLPRELFSLSKKRIMTITLRRVRVMHSDGSFRINNLWSIRRYWHSMSQLGVYCSNDRMRPIRLAIRSSRYRISFRFITMKEASLGMCFRS